MSTARREQNVSERPDKAAGSEAAQHASRPDRLTAPSAGWSPRISRLCSRFSPTTRPAPPTAARIRAADGVKRRELDRRRRPPHPATSSFSPCPCRSSARPSPPSARICAPARRCSTSVRSKCCRRRSCAPNCPIMSTLSAPIRCSARKARAAAIKGLKIVVCPIRGGRRAASRRFPAQDLRARRDHRHAGGARSRGRDGAGPDPSHRQGAGRDGAPAPQHDHRQLRPADARRGHGAP